MKQVIVLLLLLTISLSLFTLSSFGLSLDEDDIVPPKKIETLEEYQQWQKENPPAGGITWGKFSVLGEYGPNIESDCIAYTAYYHYVAENRIYNIRVTDLSIAMQYNNYDPFLDPDYFSERKEYWKPYLSIIDLMTTKEYLNVKRKEPDVINRPDIVWMQSSNLDTIDMTVLDPSLNESKFACLNDNLVFHYVSKFGGLIEISWSHNGLYYQLDCEDEHGNMSAYNETDIDIVRRLTNLETCEEALNELMSEISDNAVAEMPKGMPRDELTGGDTTAPGDDATDTGENAIGSDENEKNKDSKTESVLPWVFLGAAGVLVLATALGILLHSRKKH